MKMDQAKIAEYEAKLIYAKNDYERIDQLYKKGVSTKDEMESALSQYKSYQASLLGAKAEFILSEDDYKHCRIYSPISGVIGLTNYTEGNYITPSSGILVTIIQLDPIRVKFSMSTRDFLNNFSDIEGLKKNCTVRIKMADNSFFDEEGAIELFQCMWASMAQCLDLAITPYNKATHEGYSHWEAVTVGGQTRDGRDATNELSYIIMRSKRECPLHYPDLAARVHSRSPERFLTAVAEMIKQGCGFPKLLNDDEIIPLHLAKGAPLEDIYDYAASGCAEIRMPRVDTYTSGHAQMNFGAAVELVLYNGRMKKYGDELLTVETGDVRNFTTWEEFWQAYATQQNYLMRHAFMQQYHIIKARAQHFATPISDALHVLAMKECVDLHQDHHYEGGLDLGYFECLGYSTAIDSLSAVRKLVFDDKKLTMQELLDALECNFEGKEDVRKMLQSAPCYGNNDDYADSIGLEIDRLAQEFSKKYAPRLGIKCDFRMVPFTSHVPFGRVVSATPNGRKAWTPLSDGSSASHGADVNGPTAVLLSNFNSKNYNMFQRAARLLNIKFTPSCLAGKEGTRKLVSFIRAFVDLRLWHVQFNVVNRQTLVNAQKDPEKYRGLIVRIAGYSAYFTELSKDLQDDLIARTQHEQV